MVADHMPPAGFVQPAGTLRRVWCSSGKFTMRSAAGHSAGGNPPLGLSRSLPRSPFLSRFSRTFAIFVFQPPAAICLVPSAFSFFGLLANWFIGSFSSPLSFLLSNYRHIQLPQLYSLLVDKSELMCYNKGNSPRCTLPCQRSTPRPPTAVRRPSLDPAALPGTARQGRCAGRAPLRGRRRRSSAHWPTHHLSLLSSTPFIRFKRRKNENVKNPHEIEGSQPFSRRKTVTVRNTDEPRANARSRVSLFPCHLLP